MLHSNQAELNQLYDSFCRAWSSGCQATLTTTCSDGKVIAKLELQLGKPTDPRPGAPPPHRRSVPPFSSNGDQATGTPRRRKTHRGPAALEKSRARAAAYQNRTRTDPTGGTVSVPPPHTGGTVPVPPPPPPPPPPLALSPATRMIKFLPRKTGTRPSFSQLDGEDDTVSSPPPSSAPDASSGEGEDDIIDVGNCGWSGGNRDGVRFCSLYKTPPAKVKSSITELGTGLFCEIDKITGNYVYEFENGELYEF